MKFEQIFADGVAEVGFGGGAIRVDLYTLSQDKRDENGNPQRELINRIVMTPQGFIEAVASLQGMAEKLVELGVLSRREAVKDAPAVPSSPNFN